MMISRRNMLKLAGFGTMAATGAIALRNMPLRMVSAAPRAALTPRKLITVLVEGGWDTTYVTDPKISNTKLDAPTGTARRVGGLTICSDASRPAVDAFFEKYGAQSSIVRGISVASIGHRGCKLRILTGTRDTVNPDVNALVAHYNGGTLPLPYLVVGDTAFSGPYGSESARVGQTGQLISLVDPAASVRPIEAAALPLQLSDQERGLRDQYNQARLQRVAQVRGAAGYNQKRIADFTASMRRADSLLLASEALGPRGSVRTLPALAPIAVRALSQGLTYSVMLNTNGPWDTHTDNSLQGELHDSLFGGLSLLLDLLTATPGTTAGSRMIDETVVAVISEMSRTPKLDAVGGKGHWPVTAAMVIGAGVKSGVYGATSDSMEALAVDFASGATSSGGRVLETKNFVAGLLTVCGVDAAAALPGAEVFNAFCA
jgi:hypothetical protein